MWHKRNRDSRHGFVCHTRPSFEQHPSETSIIGKVANLEIYHRALNFYREQQPTLLTERIPKRTRATPRTIFGADVMSSSSIWLRWNASSDTFRFVSIESKTKYIKRRNRVEQVSASIPDSPRAKTRSEGRWTARTGPFEARETVWSAILDRWIGLHY